MCKLVYNKYSPDKKDLSILLTFLGWLIVGFLICIIGINDVFALNVNSDYVKIFDNYGTSLSEVTTVKVTSPKTYWTGTIPKIIANSNGGAIIIQTDTPLAKGVNYSLSINLIIYSSDGTTVYNTAISSKFNLGIGTGVQNTKDSYFNNTGTNVLSKEKTGNYIYYNFTTNTNGSYILVPFTTETSCNNGCIVEYYGYDLISNGLASDLSASDITNITNSQTNELNNSIQNSTDTITGEIDDMEQSIIDSNKETQEVIKDQFNNCRDSVNLIDESLIQSGNPYYYYMYLDNVNELYTLSIKIKDNGISKPISIGFAENNILPLTNYSWLMNEGIIGGLNTNNNFKYINNLQSYVYRKYVVVYLNGYTLNDLFDNYYIQLQKGSFTNYEPYGEEVCSNKIDETNDKLNNIDDTLNNSDSSGATNDASNFFSNFTTDTFGLTSVITAPLNIINSITSSSCNDLNLPLPYLDNKYITLPCMNSIYSKYFGTLFSLYQTITFGIVSYWVIVRIFNQVKDFKNPEHDEIEVLDL